MEAWQGLSEEGRGAERILLLIGTGADAADLRTRLSALDDNRIRWIDRFVNDRPLMRRYLSAADLYVLPSRHEGFAVAPLEAMACGLPVVAADAPGIADILPRGEGSGGLVVPREDAGALASALERLIAAPDESAELGARARLEVERRFSYANVGQALESFIFGARPGRA